MAAVTLITHEKNIARISIVLFYMAMQLTSYVHQPWSPHNHKDERERGVVARFSRERELNICSPVGLRPKFAHDTGLGELRRPSSHVPMDGWMQLLGYPH